MTAKNTEILRDTFRLLDTHEHVPRDEDTSYWYSLTSKAGLMVNKWDNDPLATNLAYAIIETQEAEYKAKQKEHQMRFDTMGGGGIL